MKNFIFFCTLGIFFCACSPYNEQIKREYDTQHYMQTYKTLQKATQDKSNDWLLWKMQSGFLTFGYFGAHFSIQDLESAEQQFKIYEGQGLLSGFGANVGATLSNDLAIPYRGLLLEGSFLNFYKALAFSSLGDNVQARVEFNRANDRQRRAKDYYRKEIQKAHDKAVEEANKKAQSNAYEQNTSDSNIQDIMNQKYTNLKNFAVYKDMINPIIPYVSGLYFMIEQDYAKSIDLLKESYGISKADIIAQDMRLLESRKGRKEYPKYTWIVIEDGDMARKSGEEMSLPLAIGSGINAFNLALPIFKEGRPTHTTYIVNASRAIPVSSVSNLFASEFEKQLPSILTRAMVSALVKFGITQAINEFGGDYGAIVGLATTFAFSAATTADTRTSIILPDSIWVARVPNTNAEVSIQANGVEVLKLPVTQECDSIPMRKASKDALDSLIKAKPKDFSARIKLFKHYYEGGNEDRLCALTDNIVYMRAHRGTIAHTIVKGE